MYIMYGSGYLSGVTLSGNIAVSAMSFYVVLGERIRGGVADHGFLCMCALLLLVFCDGLYHICVDLS